MAKKIDFLIFNNLKNFDVALSLKSDMVNEGDMNFNDPSNQKNREVFFESLHIDHLDKIRNKQIHSKIINNAKKNLVLDGDGLYSDDFTNALYLLTADCYNIFFTTKNGKIFGTLHAGWKGILEGIVEESLKIFSGETQTLILQGICEKHFIVEKDVMEIFLKKYGEKYIKENKEKFSIDLRNIIFDILKNVSSVNNVSICNVCNKDKLFSYREGDIYKRNMSIIWRSFQ